MNKPKILIQLDPDRHASSFDAIVAFDSDVDQLLQYSHVGPKDVEGLVHGSMFTRGPKDLHRTALFFGGSNIARAEALVDQTKKTFFGPMRVSLMSDPNGCNTTAVAAVLSAEKHAELRGATVAVLGGTGPVGARIARICAAQGANVRLASRQLDRAQEACDTISAIVDQASLTAIQSTSATGVVDAIMGCQIVFAAGAAGIKLLSEEWQSLTPLPQILIDLNAVPPEGIAGVNVMDCGRDLNGSIVYGAIGVGGLKMKIHRECIRQLFESNDQVLEVDEIYQIGRRLQS